MIKGKLDEAQLIAVDAGRMSIRTNSFRKLINGGQRNPEPMVSQPEHTNNSAAFNN